VGWTVTAEDDFQAALDFAGAPYLPLDWHVLSGEWAWYDTRRAAEDAAARAFSNLTPEPG
jgi:hypothetical protein